MFVCYECKAEVLYGEPHRLAVYVGSLTKEPHHIEQRCQLCAEYLAWGCWNEDDMGPCPYFKRQEGHA